MRIERRLGRSLAQPLTGHVPLISIDPMQSASTAPELDTFLARLKRRRLYRGLIWYPFAVALWAFVFFYLWKGQGLLMLATMCTIFWAYCAHIMYCQFHTEDQREQALAIRLFWYGLITLTGVYTLFAWGMFACYVLESAGYPVLSL